MYHVLVLKKCPHTRTFQIHRSICGEIIFLSTGQRENLPQFHAFFFIFLSIVFNIYQTLF